MRIFIASIIVGLVLLSSGLVLSSREGTTEQSFVRRIELARGALERSSTAFLSVDEKEVPQLKTPYELLLAESTLPQSFAFEFADLATLYHLIHTCQRSQVDVERLPAALKKAIVFERHRCFGEPLPTGFFDSPPFVHPYRGQSYAALGVSVLNKDRDSWLARHQGSFHLREFAQFNIPITKSLEILLALEDSVLEALLRGERIQFVAPYLYVAEMSAGALSVKVFDAVSLNAILASFGVLLLPTSEKCPYLQGGLCWTDRQVSLVPKALSYAGIAFVLVGLWGALFRLYSANAAQKRREKLMVETLTHELRTPIASLKLIRETFRANFEKMGPDLQDAFLRFSDEVQRLSKLSNESIHYLKSSEISDGMPLVELKSVVSFVDNFLEKWPKLKIEPPSRDAVLLCHPYWLEVCLNNLIDNAYKHGAEPVELKTILTDGEVAFVVQDCGTLKAGKISHLKSSSVPSRGLGIGLSLCEKILNSMDAKLTVETAPTRFAVTFKEKE